MNQIVAVNNVEYYVEQAGQGPPLLLLHGFSGCSQNWRPFIGEWSTQHHLVAVDLIGHGRSHCPTNSQRYHIDKAANDLITILVKLGLSSVDLLGYSMGGRLALATAVTYPKLINRLILESASPGLPTTAERSERRKHDNKLADFIEHEGITAFVDRWEQVPLFATQQQLPVTTRERLRQQRLQNQPLGLANSLRGMGTGQQPSLWPALPDLTVPTLLLAGGLDHKFVDINQRMQRLMPNATLKIVPDAGHTIHLERPYQFAQLVDEWLKW